MVAVGSTLLAALSPSVEDPDNSKVQHYRHIVLIIAGIATGIAVLLSLITVGQHVRHYRRPDLQRRIIRILLMVPIYAIDSIVSLKYYKAAVYVDTLRDCYESYVIYQFFSLLVAYLGGEQELRHMLITHGPMQHPWPFNCCLKPVIVSHPYFFKRMMRGVLQFTLIKPLLAGLKLILYACSAYDNGSFTANNGYVYIAILDNFSITLAMYCLVLFYLATKHELAPFNPIPKFLCVKAVIFFSFWQGVLIAGLVEVKVIHDVGDYTSENVASGAQDFLICIEMAVFAVWHMFTFTSKDFEAIMASSLPFYYTVRDIFSVHDDVQDTRTAFNIRSSNNLYANLPRGILVDDELADVAFTDTDANSELEKSYCRAVHVVPALSIDNRNHMFSQEVNTDDDEENDVSPVELCRPANSQGRLVVRFCFAKHCETSVLEIREASRKYLQSKMSLLTTSS